MLQNVNLEEVKQFNVSLKQYKDRAATLNAEIEYTNKELDSLCAELTAELGVQVTRDNIEQIYNEQVAKINSTLQSGNAVLAKIASEEQALSAGGAAVTQSVTAQPVAQATPVANTQTFTQPVQTVDTQQTTVNNGVGTTTQNTMFNGQASAIPNSLPPLFSLPQ